MPRRPRPGNWATLYAEIPPDLKAWLERQASANMRSTTAELIVLLQAHLDSRFKRPVAAGFSVAAHSDDDGLAAAPPPDEPDPEPRGQKSDPARKPAKKGRRRKGK